MLDLLLPPIIIVVAFGILAWIVWRKKPEAERLFSEEKNLHKQRIASNMDRLPAFVGSVSSKIARIRLNKEEARKKANALKKGIHALLDGVKTEPQEKEAFVPPTNMAADEKVFTNITQPARKREIRETETTPVVQETVSRNERPLPVSPQPPQEGEERTQYEDILIERIALNPRDIEAYERLGDYYMDRESYDDAKECYKQVLRLSPMNRKAKVRMRKLERILGKRLQAS